MKALLVLLLASVAFGQKPCVGGEHPNNAPDCIPAGTMLWPTVASMKIVSIGKLKCKDDQHVEGDGKSQSGNHCVDDSKPLKCGKYEHPVAGTRTCASSARIHTDAEADKECPWTQIIECAPDMHEVTEKEWQALMARLKKLEPKPAQVFTANRISCPAGKHPTKEKGDISIERICVDDAVAGKE